MDDDAVQLDPIMPGALLGVLGGGQLGAMFAAAARRMGYRVAVITDTQECPAARHADRLHVGSYDDPAFLSQAAEGLSVVTFEFENVPAAAGEALKAAVPVRPHPRSFSQHRAGSGKKHFLSNEAFRAGGTQSFAPRKSYERRLIILVYQPFLKHQHLAMTEKVRGC